MSDQKRSQRWVMWKNVDTTDDPSCPAFGLVELAGYEMIGSQLILHGRSASAFDREPNIEIISEDGVLSYEFKDNQQGAYWAHVFNGEASVEPGKIGHCTFDLPAYVATGSNGSPVSGLLPTFGSFVTCGNFFFAPGVGDVDVGPDERHVIEMPEDAIRRVGKPWRVAMIPGDYTKTNEAGWNVYQHTVTEANYGRAFIGGIRTFLRGPTSDD